LPLRSDANDVMPRVGRGAAGARSRGILHFRGAGVARPRRPADWGPKAAVSADPHFDAARLGLFLLRNAELEHSIF
jgi:hypothetical protein